MITIQEAVGRACDVYAALTGEPRRYVEARSFEAGYRMGREHERNRAKILTSLRDTSVK